MDSFMKPLLIEYGKHIKQIILLDNTSFKDDDDFLDAWKSIMKSVSMKIDSVEKKKVSPKKKPAEKDKKTCSATLKTGPNNGEKCGKPCTKDSDYCSRHHKDDNSEKKKDVPKKEHKSVPKDRKSFLVCQQKNGMLIIKDPSPDGSVFVINNKNDKAVCGKLSDDEKNIVPLSKSDMEFLKSENITVVDGPFATKKDLEDVLDDMEDDEIVNDLDDDTDE